MRERRLVGGWNGVRKEVNVAREKEAALGLVCWRRLIDSEVKRSQLLEETG